MDEVLFVLGMGRSGTSALARTLSLCGGTLPKRLIPSNDANVEGYWEPLDAMELNSQFLGDRGSSWFDPTLRLTSEATAESNEAFVAAIAAFLAAAPYGPLIVKEPRISALAAFWFAGAARARKRVKCIVNVRAADAVAESLFRRIATPPDVAQVLWLKYTLIAERASRGTVRAFVAYDVLLADWRRTIETVSRALAIGFVLDASQEVDRLLEPRPNERALKHSTQALPWVDAVYDRLCRAVTGEELDIALLDAAYDAFRSATQSVDVPEPSLRERALPDWDTKANWEEVATRIAVALRGAGE